MKKFYLFVGTRPNFMKAAPLCDELKKNKQPFRIIHSGQHFDEKLSDVFIKDLMKSHKVEKLDCEIGYNAIKNTENILRRTKVLLSENIDDVRAVIVFGDVLTTFAVALAAKSLDIPIVHVESGLRSFDISMPEELHRITVDHISDILLAPSQDACDNLENEGINDKFLVGNIMIDSLVKILKRMRHVKNPNGKERHIVVTLHRPSNVDNIKKLSEIITQLELLSYHHNIDFFVHPRTNAKILKSNLFNRLIDNKKINLYSPSNYATFIMYVYYSCGVITDSGGIQEETSFMNIPCLTVRDNTERPITVEKGTNKLVAYNKIADSFPKKFDISDPKTIPFWDGNTSQRIYNIINTLL